MDDPLQLPVTLAITSVTLACEPTTQCDVQATTVYLPKDSLGTPLTRSLNRKAEQLGRLVTDSLG